MNRLLKYFRFLETDPPEPEAVKFSESGSVDSRTNSTERGATWEATILSFGKSKRAPHFVYTRENVERNLEAFNGARVYLNSSPDDFGHKKSGSKSERDLVGIFTDARVTDKDLRATFEIMPSAERLRKDMLFLESKGKLNLMQLSIDATGRAAPANYQGETLPHPVVFDRVDVDIVARGAAGGVFTKLIESLNETIHKGVVPMKNKLLSLFLTLYPAFLESKGVNDFEKIDENQLFTYLLEADKPQDRLHLPDGAQLTESLVDGLLVKVRESLGKVTEPAKKAEAVAAAPAPNHSAEIKAIQESMNSIQKENCANMLEAELAKLSIPEPLKKLIRTQHSGKLFTRAEMTESISVLRDAFAQTMPQNPVSIITAGGEDRRDKIAKGLLGMFLEASPRPLSADERKQYLGNTPAYRSFKEAYRDITGDINITGQVDRSQRFTESMISSTLGYMLQDALNVAAAREYGAMGLDTWRKWAKVTPKQDFRTNHVVRWGGYGDLPTVAQGAPYIPLTSPTDEEATYAITKKGGTEDITLEMVRNDDVGVVGQIPQKLARAAAWTLHRFAYGFIKPGTNPTIYDGLALYHNTHANTATTAMGTDGAAIFAAIKRMGKQAERDSTNRLGIRGKYIAIPIDLADSAYKSVTAAYGLANPTPSFVQSQGLEVIQVPHFDDATDFVLIADPTDVQGLEIGFLDGQTEPQIFVSDLPNVGSFFTNDVLTYKIRHIYGGAVIDYRAFDGSIVAG